MKPHFISIIKTSSYAKAKLFRCHAGQVHSVYRKTINILTDQGLLALQSAGSPLSPISLITKLSGDEMELLPISKGDTVYFHENRLETDGSQDRCRFSYEKAGVCNLEVSSSLCHAESEKLVRNLEAVINQNHSSGFDMIFSQDPESELPLMFAAARNRIATASRLYTEGNHADSARELVRLLGLGIGLTPSGDDFLCGILAGMILSGQENTLFSRTLKKEISLHLTDTIDISAAFLACALEGQFSLAVNSLRNIPSPDELLAAFSAIGHSSGMDTLCGVYFSLKLCNS